jgi:mono/diheme cytochrome c family protein
MKKAKSKSALLFSCLLVLFYSSQSFAQASSILDGVYTSDQAAAGAELYALNCAHCHEPEFYRNSLISWQGMTVLDYWYRILGNMPADNPKSLSNDEYLDIVAWVLSISGYPAGATPLQPHNYLGLLKIEGLN